MPVMMIRGGDLDLVEYEFRTFLPGEVTKTLGLEKNRYRLHKKKGKVVVKAPARIHLSVLDMNRFAPDHAGGGGIGLVIHYDRSAIIENFVAVFSKAVGYKGGFRIKATDHERKHVGLGSTSTVMIAVATALNESVGAPLSNAEL